MPVEIAGTDLTSYRTSIKPSLTSPIVDLSGRQFSRFSPHSTVTDSYKSIDVKHRTFHLLERIFLNGPFATLLHNILQNEADQILSFSLVCQHLPISFLLVDIFLDKRFNCPRIELS